MAHQGRVIKRTFKTPEGRFQIHSERPNACNFNKEKPTRLTLAKLNTGTFVVFNLQEYIYICSYANTDKVGAKSRPEMFQYRYLHHFASPEGLVHRRCRCPNA